MTRTAFQKFEACAGLMRCPKCGAPLAAAGGSLRCPGGHCYDVSAKGYVHFLPGKKQPRGYDGEFFRNRRLILEAGFYRHVESAVLQALNEAAPGRVLDAGCGEGRYALAAQADGREIFGLDASAEAIRTAASGGNPVRWMVADLANLPFRDGVMDAVLDIFTPANYAEFQRVLKPGGTLIKAVPGAAHLQELRGQLEGRLRSGAAYDNTDVLDWFRQRFGDFRQVQARATLPITPAQLDAFLRMTPLAFGLTEAERAALKTGCITVDAAVLIGRKPYR